MGGKCEHQWTYEHAVYSGNVIRRWCEVCGIIQHGAVKTWADSKVGLDEMWGEYPSGYPEEFKKEGDDG